MHLVDVAWTTVAGQLYWYSSVVVHDHAFWHRLPFAVMQCNTKVTVSMKMLYVLELAPAVNYSDNSVLMLAADPLFCRDCVEAASGIQTSAYLVQCYQQKGTSLCSMTECLWHGHKLLWQL